MTVLTHRSTSIVDHKKQKKDIVGWGKTAFVKCEPEKRSGSYITSSPKEIKKTR